RIRVTNARVCTPPRHPPRPPKEVNAVGRHFATRSDAIQMRPMQVVGVARLPSRHKIRLIRCSLIQTRTANVGRLLHSRPLRVD
ncbi:MAG TPA: hypothetical protein ACHBZA_14370, partial [Arsenophonus apicola]